MGLYVGFPKLGVPFEGPNNMDCSILGSLLGSPHVGKLPCKAGGEFDPLKGVIGVIEGGCGDVGV